MALQISQATGSRVCSEEHESCTATTRLRDTRWEYRCRPARHVQEELLLPLSREEKRPQRPMMRGRLHLLAAPASSAGTMMQTTLCCTHYDRRTLHNGNRILWHHTSQRVRTVSVSLTPVPLPENSSAAVAHSPACQKAICFLFPRTSHSSTAKRMSLLLSQILLRHASRHMHQLTGTQSVNVTLLPRMTVPHTPTRHPATRCKQCLDTQNKLPQSTTAPSKQ
ncbi:hypothetical protein ECC02_000395 [Trypanosoma cruzi]|uniref:Uncharacterized protein n=1 Tax=Trypanosoma cruzi TaxID=5693 RepID=A0A7J6YI81_TRYCR|nr:hypothetical protein ECC02_000395 [Trypanosoma cruzi]